MNIYALWRGPPLRNVSDVVLGPERVMGLY